MLEPPVMGRETGEGGQPRFDLLTRLPIELTVSVLAHNEPRDVLRAALVCRSWHIVTQDEDLWRRLFLKQRGWHVRRLDALITIRSRQRAAKSGSVWSQLRRLTLSTSDDAERYPMTWQLVYRDRHALEVNYRTAKKQSHKLFAHVNSVYALRLANACIEVENQSMEILISGSRDHSVCLWDAHTYELLRTFHDHDGSVISITADSHYFATGSSNGGIVVRSLHSGFERRVVLRAHDGNVLSLDSTDDRRLVSAGKDGYVRVWDASDGTLMEAIEAADRAINCVRAQDELVAYGVQSQLIVQNTTNRRIIHEIVPMAGGIISCLSWPNRCPHIAIGVSIPGSAASTFTGYVFLADVQEGVVTKAFSGQHKGITRSVMLDWELGRLVSLGYDGVAIAHNLATEGQLCVFPRTDDLSGLSIVFNARSIFIGNKVKEAGDPCPIVAHDLASGLECRQAF